MPKSEWILSNVQRRTFTLRFVDTPDGDKVLTQLRYQLLRYRPTSELLVRASFSGLLDFGSNPIS